MGKQVITAVAKSQIENREIFGIDMGGNLWDAAAKSLKLSFGVSQKSGICPFSPVTAAGSELKIANPVCFAIHPKSRLVTFVSRALWATAIHNCETNKNSYYGLKDKEGERKEDRLYDLIREHVQQGFLVDVFYEAGRYGFSPARIMMSLGARVHILPINKLKVLDSH